MDNLERTLIYFFPDNSRNNLKYAIIFAHTYKSNTSFETVKGLLFCTFTITTKTLCFRKIMKKHRMCFLPPRSQLTWSSPQKWPEIQRNCKKKDKPKTGLDDWPACELWRVNWPKAKSGSVWNAALYFSTHTSPYKSFTTTELNCGN